MLTHLCAAIGFAAPVQLQIVQGGLSTELASKLAQVRQQTGVPAMACVVVQGGQVKASAFSGVRKKGQTAKVTQNDLWQLGSVTKVFTKELIRYAVNRRQARWEQTLAQALPTYAPTMHAQVKPLTLKQVADHTAGLANSYEGNAALFPAKPTLSQTRQEHVKLSLAFAPTGSTYSNFGYVVLGVLAEKLFNMSYENALKSKLLMPWGVTNVFFGEPALVSPTQPWPHTSQAGVVSPVASCKNSLPYNTYAPAGHLSVSLAEAPKLLNGYMSAGGPGITFNGSNGRNYARIRLSTSKNYAYLIMTNCGGDSAIAAVDAVQAWIGGNIPSP